MPYSRWPRAVLCALVFTSALTMFASITLSDVDSEMQYMRTEANRPQSHPKGTFKAKASNGWGLWMEAEMNFRNGNAILGPTDLSLEWLEVNGSFIPTVATASGASRVLFNVFSEEDALRLALWVAGRKLSIPFSAPPIDHPAHKLLKDNRYRSPSHGFTRLTTSPASLERIQIDKSNTTLLIHPVLDTPALIQAMGYIDFSDADIQEPTTEMVVIPHTQSAALIRDLNGLEDVPGSGSSYTNADVHAKFTCDLMTGTLNGTPLRYYWTHDSDNHIQFHLVAEFIEPETLPEQAPEELETRQREAVELYRLASAFSAFANTNRDELLRFIDQAFERAEEE